MNEINIKKLERWISAAGGLALAFVGVRRRSLILAGVGAVLAKRGIVGHSRLYERLATRKLRRAHPKDAEHDGERRYGNGKRDYVDEASWESFPASDPPSYVPSKIG